MKLEEAPDELLIDTLASIATKAHALDLDLISSCRRLSSLMSTYRNELLSRMDGGSNARNKKIVQDLMDNATTAHNDNPDEAWTNHIAHKQEILARIQEKSLVTVT